MSQSKAKPDRPLLVLDFRCDKCGEKIDAVIVAHATVPKKIAKSYHGRCWEKKVQPTTNFQAQSAGVN